MERAHIHMGRPGSARRRCQAAREVRADENFLRAKNALRGRAASPSAGDVLRAHVEAGTVGGVWARVRMPMRGVHSAIPFQF